MPVHSRPTIRILAESRPRSACTNFARCTAYALPAILARTASPTHSPPACPPAFTKPAGCPGTPTTKSASHPLSTHIPRVSCPHEEPSLHFAPLRCLTSCTPLLVSAGQTFRRLSSEAHVIVLPPSAARASPP